MYRFAATWGRSTRVSVAWAMGAGSLAGGRAGRPSPQRAKGSGGARLDCTLRSAAGRACRTARGGPATAPRHRDSGVRTPAWSGDEGATWLRPGSVGGLHLSPSGAGRPTPNRPDEPQQERTVIEQDED